MEYVVGFFVTQDDEVILIRKNKPKWQSGLLNGIGGKVDKMETIRMAMVREFMEETDLYTTDAQWHYFCQWETCEENTVHFFITCDILTSTEWMVLDCKHIEEGTIEIVSVDQVAGEQQIIRNLTWLIPMGLQSLEDNLAVINVFETSQETAREW